MSEKSNLRSPDSVERLISLDTRVNLFQAEMRDRLKRIDGNMELLLAVYHQGQGERKLMRILIGCLGAVSGGIAGWLTHFWWHHP